MPPGGHPARAEALATLSRVVHEKFVDDEIGRLLERLRPVEESLEYDSDDASADPRHPARLGEAAARSDRAARRADARVGARQPGLDRGARDERLREVPARAPAQSRAQAALRRVLRVGRLAVHAAPRRLRAVHEDVRGDRGVRDDPARARRARARGAARRRVVPRTSRSRRTRRRPSTSASSRRSASRRGRTGSIRPCTRSARRSRRRDVRMTTRYESRVSTGSGRRCTRRATATTRTGSRRRSSARRSRPRRRWD